MSTAAKGIIFEGVYFTDLHLLHRSISTRLDNSSEAALRKLEFVLDYAASHGIKHVLHGGDLVSDAIDSDEYKGRINRILRKAKDQGTLFLTLVGNHDVAHRDFDKYVRRPINIIESAGLAEILNTQLLLVGILGISAYDEEIVNRLSEQEAQIVRVILGHHYINAGPDKLILPLADLKTKFPNLTHIFVGHDHNEYPDRTTLGVTIVRPGGALRVSTAKENVERAPKALVVRIHEDWSVTYTALILPHRSAAEIFDLTAKAIDKDADAQLEEFQETLASTKAVGVDVESLVQAKLTGMADKMDKATYDALTEDVLHDREALLSA